MFILDDIAKAPFQGFLFIAREVANAVQKEHDDDKARLMTDLKSLHRQLELGLIDAKEFDKLEAQLLDRLEQFESD